MNALEVDADFFDLCGRYRPDEVDDCEEVRGLVAIDCIVFFSIVCGDFELLEAIEMHRVNLLQHRISRRHAPRHRKLLACRETEPACN